MASRIFPTKQNDKLERSSAVKTIGAEQLSTEMNKLSEIKADMTKTASVNDKPVDRKKKRYAMTPQKCESCGVEHPCSCDIVAAQAEGDHEKVAVMMEARANRRSAHMQEIEGVSADEGLNERTAFRTQLLDELQKFAQDDETPDAEACGGNVFGSCKKCGGVGEKCTCPKCPDCKCKPCECKDKKAGFEPVNKISAAKKKYFARYAEAMGWPVEYVEAITASSVKTAFIPEATKMVLSNKQLEKDNKKHLIIAMHKESKLSPEQANRIRTYWSQELNYPDTEWISDLVEEPSGK